MQQTFGEFIFYTWNSPGVAKLPQVSHEAGAYRSVCVCFAAKLSVCEAVGAAWLCIESSVSSLLPRSHSPGFDLLQCAEMEGGLVYLNDVSVNRGGRGPPLKEQS